MVRVLRRRTDAVTGEVEEAEHFFGKSDATMTAEKAYRYTRDHWSVENELHWVLDVDVDGTELAPLSA